MPARILMIDDDASLARVVTLALQAEGYEVVVARDGMEGLQQLYRSQPDLVILDVVMPGMNGWETCQRIRELCNVPILMLTGRSEERDEMKGLQLGADFYMTKPFAVPMLMVRLKALLRRSQATNNKMAQPVLAIGDLRIDRARRQAFRGDQPRDLSPTEFRLLEALAARPGEVISHQELLRQVWGPEYVDEDFYLKLYISYLRRKIEDDPTQPRYIKTRRGVGYSLDYGLAAGGGSS